jgi:archaellum component FlaC
MKKMKDSKEKLIEFNKISEEKFPKIQKSLEKHNKMIIEMKTDLEFITKTLKQLKLKTEKLSIKYNN